MVVYFGDTILEEVTRRYEIDNHSYVSEDKCRPFFLINGQDDYCASLTNCLLLASCAFEKNMHRFATVETTPVSLSKL
jgi:hypothetical protein